MTCMHCGKVVKTGRAMICDHCNQPYSPQAQAMFNDPVLRMAALGAFSAATAEAQRSHINWRGFWIGMIVGLGALSFSISSLQSATSGGGQYFVLWGAVLWGGWKVLKSLGGE